LDSFIEAVAENLPELMDYVSSSYECPSSLAFGYFTLSSNEEVQQGHPLRPLLFNMALDKAHKLRKCDMVAAYLDDVVLGRKVEAFGVELPRFSAPALVIGLVLNESKCEIISLNSSARPKWRADELRLTILHLGSPHFPKLFCPGRPFLMLA